MPESRRVPRLIISKIPIFLFIFCFPVTPAFDIFFQPFGGYATPDFADYAIRHVRQRAENWPLLVKRRPVLQPAAGRAQLHLCLCISRIIT